VQDKGRWSLGRPLPTNIAPQCGSGAFLSGGRFWRILLFQVAVTEL